MERDGRTTSHNMQAGAAASANRVRYRTIVVDPPWEYGEGFVQGPSHGNGRNDVTLPYGSMSLERICQLPIRDLADPAGARLFVWTTNKYLPDAFDLIAEWGFRYSQTLVWRKTGCPTPFASSVAPNHAEYLLTAVRGKCPLVSRWPSSVVDAPVRRHSQKPEAIMDLIEQASPAPRIELFARRQRLGWSTWGNEALEHEVVV